MNVFVRWRTDLRKNFEYPVWANPEWASEFRDEIDSDDARYAIFLVVLGLVPAGLIAHFSKASTVAMLAQLFGAPLQTVVNGFLTSVLIFLGGHVNRVPKPYPLAFKLMLRVMALYPILSFLLFWRGGESLRLLALGAFVIAAVRRVYGFPLQNTLLFFGITYFVFALMQLQQVAIQP